MDTHRGHQGDDLRGAGPVCDQGAVTQALIVLFAPRSRINLVGQKDINN